MARIAKMTIMVDMTMNTQTVHVRTTGKRGTTLLNTISTDAVESTQSPFDTAPNFWHDVLTKAAATF